MRERAPPLASKKPMTAVTLEIPDDLAQEAGEAGLLAPEAVQAMLRDQLRRHRLGELLRRADRLEAANLPQMTLDEIQEEVNAVRAEGRRSAAGS